MMQMENTDCGAVALGIVLAFYGCYVPFDELREQCEVSRDGISIASLIKAAQHYHLTATIHKDCPTSEQYNYPLILFCNRKHFIVLEGFKGKKVYVNDPGTGRRTVDQVTLKKEFSGIAIQLIPSTQFHRRAREKKWLKYVFSWMKKERTNLFFLLSSTVILTLLNLATPIFSKYFVDHYTVQNAINYHSSLVMMIFVALAMQIVIVYVQRKTIRYLEKEGSEEMGNALINKLMHLPTVFFAHRRVGDLAQRLQSVERLAEMLSGSLSIAVVGIFQLIISLILMFHFSSILTVLACFILLVNFSFFYFSKTYRQQLASVLKKEFVNLNALTMGAFSMILQIKVKGQNQFLTQWKGQLKQYLSAQRQFSLVNMLIQSGIYLLAGIIQVLILGLGGWLAIKNEISIGSLIAFNGLFLSLNELVISNGQLRKSA